MQLSRGYSGSNLQLINGIVRKESSYLKRCPDYNARRKFLKELSVSFAHMPKMRFFDDGIIEMDYIDGQEGIEDIDFEHYGKIVRELHELDIKAPYKDTGINWLLENARTNLKKNGREDANDLFRIFNGLTDDSVVHGEITQLITDSDQNLYIIDWDECGLGSKYQDLGFIYYRLKLDDRISECFDKFLDGYGTDSVDISLIPQVAGLIAIAYSGFSDFEKRIKIGEELLSNAPYALL